MTVFRLSKEKYIRDLSGHGAELTGGRWNSKGIAVLYTAESRALAALETAVHIPLSIIPVNYFMATIELPDDASIMRIGFDKMPVNWNQNPFIKTTQKIGDEFVKNNRYLVLQVPSATVKGDYNYLINPANMAFAGVKIVNVESFEFDGRLFKA
jgi:RES domain-containing protein